MRTRLLIVVACLLFSSASGHAQIAKETLANVTVVDNRGAQLPPINLRGIDGSTQQYPDPSKSRPAILLLVDYTCSTMCGTMTGALAQALEETPLQIARDYRVHVIGFDPKDGEADANAFRDSHLRQSRLAGDFEFFRGSRDAIETLSNAVGFALAYDSARDQFAHPAALTIVTPEGRISRSLDILELTPFNLRLALVEAMEGRIGSLSDRVALLCYGWDATAGVYTLQIRRVLTIAGFVTLVLLLGFIVLLRRREHLAMRAGRG